MNEETTKERRRKDEETEKKRRRNSEETIKQKRNLNKAKTKKIKAYETSKSIFNGSVLDSFCKL